MKKLITLLLLTLVSPLSLLFGQTDPVKYMVHEVIVKPSMDVQYREATKKLIAACEGNKTSFGWTAVSHDDNSYLYLAPMKDFSELGVSHFAELRKKLGDEAMNKIWSAIDECTVSSSDYVVAMLPEFSYLGPPPAEEHYRDVTYWWPLHGKNPEAQKLLAEWKKLYESKKSQDGYTVYRVLYGRELGYAIVSWGKNRLDAATKASKSDELLGEESHKLWLRTQAISWKYENKRAWINSDLSYTPAK